MEWFRLDVNAAAAGDFVTKVNVNGKKLCLIRNNNKFYATQVYCPHAGADLTYGWCEKGHLICPNHRYEYNLETGRGATDQGDYVDMYPVEERKDGLYIGLKKSWWQKLW